jgi:phenylpropionate dioxygenase-like ring-hydroxylating dioxygenase large terminal subunit
MVLPLRSNGSTLPPLLWMSRARQQLTKRLEEATCAVPSSASQEPLVTRFNPRETYFDVARDQVALQAPYPVVPSMALPPGHAVARRHPQGTPLLVYRDKKDPSQLRAFVNACAHRGSPLLHAPPSGQFETKPLTAPLLTCPYHAWTYDANSGALRKIPGHAKAFGLMSPSQFQLEPVTCTEQAGYVWVGGDTMRQQGLWQMEEMEATLKPFLHDPSSPSTPASAYKIIGYREWLIQANWQLLVETALESYHVPVLHQKTFHLVTDPTEGTMVSQYQDNNKNVTMTVPLRNFTRRTTNDDNWTDQDTLRFLGDTTTTHLLFPYSFVTLFKRFLMFMTVEPVMPSTTSKHDTPSTSTIIRAWTLSHRFYDSSEQEEGEAIQQRDLAGVMAAVQEDFECTERIQQGLNFDSHYGKRPRNKKDFIYGSYEANNIKFLNNVCSVAKQLDEGSLAREESGS